MEADSGRMLRVGRFRRNLRQLEQSLELQALRMKLLRDVNQVSPLVQDLARTRGVDLKEFLRDLRPETCHPGGHVRYVHAWWAHSEQWPSFAARRRPHAIGEGAKASGIHATKAFGDPHAAPGLLRVALQDGELSAKANLGPAKLLAYQSKAVVVLRTMTPEIICRALRGRMIDEAVMHPLLASRAYPIESCFSDEADGTTIWFRTPPIPFAPPFRLVRSERLGIVDVDGSDV
ncbi:hypothetical protein [Sphingomonas sp.]|jgi:hypothetical protein|uniref:hypothetical protein n=1 Tax=Sphingomonas sp. TaxID=28214 RepID=UPI002DF17D06|nr:hypothetical protein [Sphingomonas sp.]